MRAATRVAQKDNPTAAWSVERKVELTAARMVAQKVVKTAVQMVVYSAACWAELMAEKKAACSGNHWAAYLAVWTADSRAGSKADLRAGQKGVNLVVLTVAWKASH